MPEEIKKVLIAAMEGVSGSDVYEAVRAGSMPSLQRLMADGVAIPGIAVDATAASSWATLATGAHASTHGEGEGKDCRAQYIWQAAERASKRGLLLGGFPASSPPELQSAHPEDLVRPEAQDAGYYEQVNSYLLSSPDWDIALVRIPASAEGLGEADDAAGRVLDTADFETMRVLVVVPDGPGDGFAILEGPGIRRGTVVERPVELADIAPTICYLAELPVPAECEGGIIYQALEDPDCKILELQSCRRNYERLRRSTGATPMC